MNRVNWRAITGSFIILLILLIVIYGISYTGYLLGESNLKVKLVEEGHAEYYLDSKNIKKWRMKKK